MDKIIDTKLLIIPDKTPQIIRRCRNCNRKMPFYCSEKFRVNGNHAKLDIWLIFKCKKCDTTWKLTIKKGVRFQDLPFEIFEGFVNNDKELVWRYAFDRPLLKGNECEVNYESISYTVEETPATNPDSGKYENNHGLINRTIEDIIELNSNKKRYIRVECQHPFDLRLNRFIASHFGISISTVRRLVENGFIETEPPYPIMKYKINSSFILVMTEGFINEY